MTPHRWIRIAAFFFIGYAVFNAYHDHHAVEQLTGQIHTLKTALEPAPHLIPLPSENPAVRWALNTNAGQKMLTKAIGSPQHVAFAACTGNHSLITPPTYTILTKGTRRPILCGDRVDLFLEIYDAQERRLFSHTPTKAPLEFVVGSAVLPPAISFGIMNMREGEKRRIALASHAITPENQRVLASFLGIGMLEIQGFNTQWDVTIRASHRVESPPENRG